MYVIFSTCTSLSSPTTIPLITTNLKNGRHSSKLIISIQNTSILGILVAFLCLSLLFPLFSRNIFHVFMQHYQHFMLSCISQTTLVILLIFFHLLSWWVNTNALWVCPNKTDSNPASGSSLQYLLESMESGGVPMDEANKSDWSVFSLLRQACL